MCVVAIALVHLHPSSLSLILVPLSWTCLPPPPSLEKDTEQRWSLSLCCGQQWWEFPLSHNPDVPVPNSGPGPLGEGVLLSLRAALRHLEPRLPFLRPTGRTRRHLHIRRFMWFSGFSHPSPAVNHVHTGIGLPTQHGGTPWLGIQLVEENKHPGGISLPSPWTKSGHMSPHPAPRNLLVP